MKRRIVVMNCNTSSTMTEEIGRQASLRARPNTDITTMNPTWGPESAEGYYDSYVTAAAVLDRLHQIPSDTVGVVMAGFGEHGREGARELLDVPVVDVTEAGAMMAMYLAPRYGIVTTLPRACAQIHDSLLTAGLLNRCAAIEAADVPVLDLENNRSAALSAMYDAGARALDEGAEALVLGCAGMAELDAALGDKLGVPVVDCVAAAVAHLEALLDVGLVTSTTLTYATPRPKKRAGWPLSQKDTSQ